MQRGRACKGGSEVGRGCRNLPTSVFRVVRARSAWGEEPGKVSRPLLAACRRATLRVQGASGRVSDQRGEGVRDGIGYGRRGPPGMGCGPSAVAGALAGVGGDVAARTTGRCRVAVTRSASGRHFPRRLRPICARDRWRRDGSPCGTATVVHSTSVGRRRQTDVELRREG